MLFLLIDIVERILSWLKSFPIRASEESTAKSQPDLAVPMSNDLIAKFNGFSAALPVITKFEELTNDKQVNTDPKIYGVIADLAGNRIIGPTKASSRVWQEMFSIYGGQYYIRNL